MDSNSNAYDTGSLVNEKEPLMGPATLEDGAISDIFTPYFHYSTGKECLQMGKITEILTPEQAVEKFPDYVREIYESEDYNHAHQPLVAVYHYFSPDADTWDIDHWMLVFTSGYGTGVYITDVWRHAKAVPDITSFYLPNEFWEKMREVA